MTWVKLDDHMSEHPKIVQAGPLAAWLHVCALQYASRNLTDGFIPVRAVTTLANFEGVSLHLGSMLDGAIGLGDDVHIGALAETLVDVGLWEPVQGGYQIHDYLDFNPSKADVLAQRRQNADRQAAWKDRQRGNNDRTNGVPTNISNAPTNAVTDAVNSSVNNKTPYPVPVPVSSRRETGEAVVATTAMPPTADTTAPSPEARQIMDRWRAAHGKKKTPHLNPTQLQALEAAIPDLGMERLEEAVDWSAQNGVPEFIKCIRGAYTKRQQDETAYADAERARSPGQLPSRQTPQPKRNPLLAAVARRS